MDDYVFNTGMGDAEEGIPLCVNGRVTRWYIQQTFDREDKPMNDWCVWYSCPREPMYGNPDRELESVATTQRSAERKAIAAFKAARAERVTDDAEINRACFYEEF